MKTVGRVLIILIAFAIMMGITYSIVGVSSSSNNMPAFQNGGERFSPNGEQRGFRDESRGGSGFGMLFGLVKNSVIVTMIVVLVALPKNFLQQKRRAVPVRIK